MIARMEAKNGVTQVGTINMRVDFSCSDGGMTQELLNVTKIGSPLKQMGSKRVSEGMGRNGLLNTGITA